MAGKALRTHSVGLGLVEEMKVLPYATGQTFVLGALLKYDGSGNVIVMDSGTSAATLVGVALQGAGTNPGYDAANSPTTFTGRNQTVTVAIANAITQFEGQLTNNSSAIVTPTAADIGVQYGFTAYSGIWTIDKNKTGGCIITGIDTSQSVVFFKFLAAFIDQ